MTGTYTYSLDFKGRIVLPAPFREDLGRRVLITCTDSAFLVTTPARWKRLQRQAPWPVRAAAREASVDVTTGRVLLPVEMRQALGCGRYEEIVLAGYGSFVLGKPRLRGERQCPEPPGWLLRPLVTLERPTALLCLDLLRHVPCRPDEVEAALRTLEEAVGA